MYITIKNYKGKKQKYKIDFDFDDMDIETSPIFYGEVIYIDFVKDGKLIAHIDETGLSFKQQLFCKRCNKATSHHYNTEMSNGYLCTECGEMNKNISDFGDEDNEEKWEKIEI